MSVIPASAVDANRILVEVDLAPVQGSRFQPTGFPDLGPALYQLPDRTPMLLVESVQSMANRLEEAGWDRVGQQPVAVLSGLPYVRVHDPQGGFLSSSRLEAHRLASALVRESTVNGMTVEKLMEQRFGLRKNVPSDHRQIARAVFSFDPVSLLHGVFFAIKAWPIQPKVPRTLSAFIEARNVEGVYSGGLKRDDVFHTAGGQQTAERGFGNIPYSRREFVAAEIVAFFNLDLVQLRSFGLDERAEQLLLTLGLWEIRSFLEGYLRLRTACDLEVRKLRVTRPEGFELPDRRDLEGELPGLIEACSDIFGEPRVLTAVWSGRLPAEAPTAEGGGET